MVLSLRLPSADRAVSRVSVCVSQYDRLASMTTIVVDSGELDSVKKFVPQDATTNPSLLYQACQDPKSGNMQ